MASNTTVTSERLQRAMVEAFTTKEGQALPPAEQCGLLLAAAANVISMAGGDPVWCLAKMLVAVAATPEDARASFELALASLRAVERAASEKPS